MIFSGLPGSRGAPDDLRANPRCWGAASWGPLRKSLVKTCRDFVCAGSAVRKQIQDKSGEIFISPKISGRNPLFSVLEDWRGKKTHNNNHSTPAASVN